jgi:hypothetical protein
MISKGSFLHDDKGLVICDFKRYLDGKYISSVAEPELLFSDLDPTGRVITDRDPTFGFSTHSDPDPTSHFISDPDPSFYDKIELITSQMVSFSPHFSSKRPDPQ